MMDQEENCLLEALFTISGYMYLSDLKFADSACRKRLADAIESTYPVEKFPLNEWNDVLHYVIAGKPEKSSEAARDKLIQLLKK